AKADALFCSDLPEMHGETIAGHKALIQTVLKAIAAAEAAQKEVADNAARAKDRVERIERGRRARQADDARGHGKNTARCGLRDGRYKTRRDCRSQCPRPSCRRNAAQITCGKL